MDLLKEMIKDPAMDLDPAMNQWAKLWFVEKDSAMSHSSVNWVLKAPQRTGATT